MGSIGIPKGNYTRKINLLEQTESILYYAINFFILMYGHEYVADTKKEEKKDLDVNNMENCDIADTSLDGKGLHDLYRHTTKLIK